VCKTLLHYFAETLTRGRLPLLNDKAKLESSKWHIGCFVKNQGVNQPINIFLLFLSFWGFPLSQKNFCLFLEQVTETWEQNESWKSRMKSNNVKTKWNHTWTFRETAVCIDNKARRVKSEKLWSRFIWPGKGVECIPNTELLLLKIKLWISKAGFQRQILGAANYISHL